MFSLWRGREGMSHQFSQNKSLPCLYRYPTSSPKSRRAPTSTCPTTLSLSSTSQLQRAQCSSQHCPAAKRLRIQPGWFTEQPSPPCHAHATGCHADASSPRHSCRPNGHQSREQPPRPPPRSHDRKAGQHHLCRSSWRQPGCRCRLWRGHHLCQTSDHQSKGRGHPLCAHGTEGA